MIGLRTLESGDIDAVHALTSRMDVVRHMLLPLCSRDDSEKFLRESLVESPSDPRRIPGHPSSEQLRIARQVMWLGFAAWSS